MVKASTLGIPLLRGDVVFMEKNDIKFILSNSSLTFVHDIDENKYTSVFTLKKFKEILDESFYPFSQSLLVNIDVIKYLHNQNHEIELKCGIRLPVSRRGLRNFKNWLKERGGVL